MARIHLKEPMHVTLTQLDEYRFCVTLKMDDENEPPIHWVVDTKPPFGAIKYRIEEKPVVETDLDEDIDHIVYRFKSELKKVDGHGHKYTVINWRSVACGGL